MPQPTPLLTAVVAAIAFLLASKADAQIGSEFRASGPGYKLLSFPAVAVGAGGDFIVVWGDDDGSESGIFGRRYDAGGLPLAPEFQVNVYTTGNQRWPGVAVDGAGNFVIAWHDYGGRDGNLGGIFGRRFAGTGAPLGSDFQVNSYTTDDQLRPEVAIDSSGNFVVIWTSSDQDGDGGGVFGQRYDTTGTPAGGEFQVNTSTTGYQCCASVAADGSGKFVVVWSQYTFGGRQSFGQRFDAGGVSIGSEFQVNPFGTQYEVEPSVDADDSGNFVVVWKTGTFSNVVSARRFDSAGQPLGGEFQVNTSTSSLHGWPTVAIDGSGGFVVAFAGDRGETTVLGRRYDAAGMPMGGEFSLANELRGIQARPEVVSNLAGDLVAVWSGDGVRGKRLGSFHPVLGKRLLIRDPGSPGSRRITANFRTREVDAPAVFDPVANGAFLQLFRADGAGDSVCLDLPASGWRVVDPASGKYAYDDPTFANGPCKLARVRRNAPTRISCSGAGIGYTLDEPGQGAVSARFGSGAVAFCMEFANVARDVPGMFGAKRVPVPTSCAPVPPGCP